MTYFHMRMHTIIGAKSFHCPVRDGKEWGQLAMVVRHNCCQASGFGILDSVNPDTARRILKEVKRCSDCCAIR